MRRSHGHVEIVEEDDELFPTDRPKFILGALFHGLLDGGLQHSDFRVY